jgi:hypothetical protein
MSELSYLARRAIAADKVAKPFVVEHYSGRIVAACDTWHEAAIERNHQNQLEKLAQAEVAA